MPHNRLERAGRDPPGLVFGEQLGRLTGPSSGPPFKLRPPIAYKLSKAKGRSVVALISRQVILQIPTRFIGQCAKIPIRAIGHALVLIQ